MINGILFNWNKPSMAVVLGMICVFFGAGCTVFGIRTSEEANYKVLGESGRIELREYDELIVVETDVNAAYDEAGKIAFKRLFGYISGENEVKTKIAMTTPVLAKEGNSANSEQVAMTSPVFGEKNDKGWRYIFVLPDSYTLESAPVPSNQHVKLSMIPKKRLQLFASQDLGERDQCARNLKSLLIGFR